MSGLLDQALGLMDRAVRSEDAPAYAEGSPVSWPDVISEEDDLIARAMSILDQRLRKTGIDGVTMSDPSTAGRYLKLQLQPHGREVFAVLFLDTRHRLIACEELFFGTIDGCDIHPRIIAQSALAHNAAAVIIGHNHPSGNPDPSAADRAVTAQIKQALALLDVRLLDHFVVGEGEPTSMAARGWV